MTLVPHPLPLGYLSQKHEVVTVIAPSNGWRPSLLRELWRYRDLLRLLAWRDVQVRYKQTLLGVAWAVLQPLVTMVVFSLFFGQFLGISATTDSLPYPIFVYSGMLPWLFFQSSVTASSSSLVNNASMLTKVYFPRLLMPLSAIGAPLLDFAVSFVVLLGLMAWFGMVPSWSIVLLPLAVASAILAALSVSVLISALTVAYRDFRYVVPFLLQTWFYLTPVIYPVQVVPTRWSWITYLNPMAGVVEAFRSMMLGQPINLASWACSVIVGMICLATALAYFSRTERSFADII